MGRMHVFLKEIISQEKFEFLVDLRLFHKDIVLKTAYAFLDRGYFFFRIDEAAGNILLQFTAKEGVEEDAEKIIGDFSDELLSVCLRDALERENRVIREKIVSVAISNSLDDKGFVGLNTDTQDNGGQIDFDKDIDEILREIENYPKMKIDEAEIDRILKEIEAEAADFEAKGLTATLNIHAIQDAKAKF